MSTDKTIVKDQRIRPWSILLGIFLIPLNVYWVILAEFRWLNALTLNPLFVTPVFCLIVLILANALLRRVSAKLVLSPAELAVIYIMLVMSCTVAAFDFIIGIMTSIPWPAYAASEQNNWARELLPYLPKWLIITDKAALEGYFEGNKPLNQFVGAWIVQLGFWSLFILIIVWILFCLAAILRKSWTEHSKLSFPIVRLPLEMTEPITPQSIFKQKVFWGGFAVAAGLSLLNGLKEYIPTLPTLKTSPTPLFTGPNAWIINTPTYISFQPSIIGLAYLVPLDISFSCWFFYIFVKFQEIVGHIFGVSGIPDFPFLREQSIGAWYAFGIALVYGARSYFVAAAKAAFRNFEADDAEEPLSYRVAFWGLVIGSALFILFWSAAGMSVWLAALVLLLFMLVSIAITKVRAEAGSQHTITSVGPIGVFPLLGLDSLGPANAALGALSHSYWRGMRSHPMPSELEAFKLAKERGICLRKLAVPIFAAFVVATFFGFWSCLAVAYKDGALAKCYGYASWINTESYQWFAGGGLVKSSPQASRWAVVGASAGLISLLTWLRMKFSWFPFHPLGYCVGPGMVWVWFPFFTAWLLKLLILRYGGYRLFKTALPFFLGLIFGDYSTGAVWSLIEVIWHIPVYHVF